jgi:hypothetical protein
MGLGDGWLCKYCVTEVEDTLYVSCEIVHLLIWMQLLHEDTRTDFYNSNFERLDLSQSY